MHIQVLLVLRRCRHGADLHTLARDAGGSDATVYRYLHETLDVITGHTPDLYDVLERAAAVLGKIP